MEAGWCWQIEHETRINRGYVYSSAFISDQAAEREFRAKAPKAGPTRVVKFVSGRYRNHWAGNVVAVGNASGFVEPLEATALGVIATQASTLANALAASGRRFGPEQRRLSNAANARHWDAIRDFIALHYRFNTRLDTPFWRECREKTDLGGAARVVEYFRENGPNGYWETVLFDPFDPFKYRGYATLLVGMGVPYAHPHTPSPLEWTAVDQLRRQNGARAERALSVDQVLGLMRTPGWWEKVKC
jgi:tryptophan halogenase